MPMVFARNLKLRLQAKQINGNISLVESLHVIPITNGLLFQAVLPAYEEVLELPSKDSPPPYVAI